MATNTGIRKCKKCKKEFEKKYALQSYCSYECANKGKSYVERPKTEKKRSRINQESKTNMCRCSDGSMIKTSVLNKMIREAKAEKIRLMYALFGYVFCEDCYNEGVPENINEMDLKIIDCSHDVSVDECKKSGRSELAADHKNIRMRCRYHHRKKDKTL